MLILRPRWSKRGGPAVTGIWRQHTGSRWNQMYKWPSKSRDLSNLTWPVSRY